MAALTHPAHRVPCYPQRLSCAPPSHPEPHAPRRNASPRHRPGDRVRRPRGARRPRHPPAAHPRLHRRRRPPEPAPRPGPRDERREHRAHLRDRAHPAALHHRARDRPPGVAASGTVDAGAGRRSIRDQRAPRAPVLRVARLPAGRRQLRPALSRHRDLVELDPDRRQAAPGQVRAEGPVGAADAGRPRRPGRLGHPLHGGTAQHRRPRRRPDRRVDRGGRRARRGRLPREPLRARPRDGPSWS